ncbi:MAG: family N-acetyltransferase, partial [Microbacterium sp.]|nr:family N-acetyltransferase [Microbacterium sp.]
MIPESRPGSGIRSARWQTGRMLDVLPLPHSFDSRIGTAVLRRATVDDVDAVIALLADDPISAARGDVASVEDRPV